MTGRRLSGGDISSLEEGPFDDDRSTLMGSEYGADEAMLKSLELSVRNDGTNSSSLGELTSATGGSTYSKNAEIAAQHILRRTVDIRHFLYLTENFYALHGLSPHDSRATALKTVFNYMDDEEENEANEGMSVDLKNYSSTSGNIISKPMTYNSNRNINNQ